MNVERFCSTEEVSVEILQNRVNANYREIEALNSEIRWLYREMDKVLEAEGQLHQADGAFLHYLGRENICLER